MPHLFEWKRVVAVIQTTYNGGDRSDGAAHSPPHPSMNTSTSRDRLWRKRLNELSAVWPDFVSGRVNGLHKTRVASRRIREALPIVGATASPAKVKKLNKKMRALTRSLGPIRELDVELTILDDKSRAEGVPGRAIEMVRREVASRRAGVAQRAQGSRARRRFEEAAQEARARREERRGQEGRKARDKALTPNSRPSGAACSRRG